MQYGVKTERRILLLLLGGVALVFVAMPTALSYHDSRTERALLRTVGRELPLGSSMSQMKQFMGRHTTRYAFDEYNSQWGGFLPQSRVDKALLDRQVGVYLKVDEKQTLRDADVQISYTFL